MTTIIEWNFTITKHIRKCVENSLYWGYQISFEASYIFANKVSDMHLKSSCVLPNINGFGLYQLYQLTNYNVFALNSNFLLPSLKPLYNYPWFCVKTNFPFIHAYNKCKLNCHGLAVFLVDICLRFFLPKTFLYFKIPCLRMLTVFVILFILVVSISISKHPCQKCALANFYVLFGLQCKLHSIWDFNSNPNSIYL